MKNRGYLTLSLILIASMLAFWGCPKKAEVTATPEPQQEQAREAPPAPAETAPAPQAESGSERAVIATEEGLKPVYFDFDRSFIRADAKETMKANAAWLKAHPKAKVRIEGNCDEKGTIEYNQALGQRRAASAKRYLADLGIQASRISLISYGKEKPSCTNSTEDCSQKNRRDDFVASE